MPEFWGEREPTCRDRCEWACQCDRAGEAELMPSACEKATILRLYWKTPDAAMEAWEKDVHGIDIPETIEKEGEEEDG